MGTPDFAVPALEILLEAGYQVVGVVTATDKYGGRGKKKLLQSAVKQAALRHDIPVLQPRNLKDPAFLKQLRALEANLQVIVAFRMLPEAVWAMPKLGTFNLHGSLLPKYRGAAPINWAIIRGEEETGVTTFFLQQEIDTGSIIFQERLAIGENETAGDVHDRMMQLGASTVLKTVQAIAAGNPPRQAQDDTQASAAPKLFHETCEIDFHQPVQQVHNFIRGLSPYPAAWTQLEDHKLKILRCSIDTEPAKTAPGHFESDDKSYIRVATLDNYLQIHELQLQGRRRMDTKTFLNGFSFNKK